MKLIARQVPISSRRDVASSLNSDVIAPETWSPIPVPGLLGHNGSSAVHFGPADSVGGPRCASLDVLRRAEFAHRSSVGSALPTPGSRVDFASLTIRRLVKVKGVQQDWPSLSQRSAVVKAPAVVQQVLEFYAKSPNKDLEAETFESLTKMARAQAVDMPKAFVNQLADVDSVETFQAALKSAKLVPTDQLKQRLESRMAEVLKPWVTRLPTVNLLPQPTAPTGLTSSRTLVGEPAERRGRSQAGWDQVPNSFPGSGGVKTGAPNNQLMTQDFASGSMSKIDHSYFQTCPTCGQIMPASQFEVDHQQALEQIRSQLILLAQAMTADSVLLDLTEKSCTEFDSYFMVDRTSGKVTATGWAIKAYSNDLGNLARICRPCNGATGKSNHDMLDWYRDCQLLGEAFIKRYAPALGPNDNQLIARTKDGRGWGEVLIEYFENEHLPILKQGEKVLRLQQFAQQSLIRQSTHRVAKRATTDALEKEKHRNESKFHGNIGKTIVNTSEATEKYVRDPRQKKYRMRDSSPDRLGGIIEETLTKDLDEKERKDLSKKKSFRKGKKRGRSGSVADSTYRPKSKKARRYEDGYEEGRNEYLAEMKLGCQFAIDWDAKAFWDPTILERYSDAFGKGFEAMWSRRVQVYEFGQLDKRAGVPRADRVVQGEAGAERLFRDYLDGFNNA